MLSREQILSAADLPTDVIDVPAWGGKVHVRGIPFGDADFIAYVERGAVDQEVIEDAERVADEFIEAILRNVDGNQMLVGRIMSAKREFKAELLRRLSVSEEEKGRRRVAAAVVCGVIDEHGNRLFTWDDADQLRSKNYAVLNQVALAVSRLSQRVGLDDGERFPGGEPSHEAPLPTGDPQAAPPSV